jgi:enamine deaminase RidA (YjgF/YER057c/UK114 family)
MGPPRAQGSYRTASIVGDLVFVAGMTPRQDGTLMYRGRVGSDLSPDEAGKALRLATVNAITAAREALPVGGQLVSCALLTVFLRTSDDFVDHASVANAASDAVIDELGEGAMGCRVVVGVATLPGGAPVEVQLIAPWANWSEQPSEAALLDAGLGDDATAERLR